MRGRKVRMEREGMKDRARKKEVGKKGWEGEGRGVKGKRRCWSVVKDVGTWGGVERRERCRGKGVGQEKGRAGSSRTYTVSLLNYFSLSISLSLSLF